ncbi:MAG TPA: MtrB/PioB family outer membrane beta-barrel protein [Thermodesulfobacteriota bacterium]
MNRTLLLALSAVFLQASVSRGAQEPASGMEASAGLTAGYQHVAGGESGKFNEYRDIRDGAYLYRLDMGLLDRSSGRSMGFKGTNLLRDDQNALLTAAGRGWSLKLEWDEIPHLISTKARTPYDYNGGGLFTAPSTAGIDMSTAGASAAKDAIVADYLDSALRAIELGTRRERARAAVSLKAGPELSFNLQAGIESKEGFEITSAPIGDRPPRAMNIQIPEPIDYTSSELGLSAEYVKEDYQIQFSYLLSAFENEVDSLTWENIFFEPTSGTSTTVEDGATDRRFSTIGRTALYPDNIYQNVTLSTGLNLPMDSRLDATVSYSRFDQNEDLLPYSASDLGLDWDSLSNLPRTEADAKMNATYLRINYSVNPASRLGLRTFYSYYGLNNDTKTDDWYYVTQDAASNTSGGVSSTNQRRNLAYAYTKQNYGLDAYYLFGGSRLGAGYEREDTGRDFREADTVEDMLKASLSTRLAGAINLKLKYLYGERDSGAYNGDVTDASYHLSNAAESGNDRPLSAFGNHPDLRKFDVADRRRNQLDVTASMSPAQDLSISAAYNFREDDFDSGTSAAEPLAATAFAAALGVTPGDQLGLLKERRDVYSADASYFHGSGLKLSVFYSREMVEQTQRGMSFNENARISSGFDWDEAGQQWTAVTEDRTDTVGIAAVYPIIPDKLSLSTDYTYSYGTVEIEYAGFGSDKPLNSNTYYYAFSDPEKVSHRHHVLNVKLEYRAFTNMTVYLGYLYDKYKIKDWMLSPSGGWVEQVGSEFLLRDSSVDNRWGNRLVTLGGLLAPGYEAHVGTISVSYNF